MDNRVSVRYSDLGPERADVRPILEGDLDGLPLLPSRTVRVFLSSTFSDMSPERNTLMEYAYPKLKEYCRQKYRFEFQVMDLRWGIREQSHDDHTIIEFCLREIENCKKTSVGPSFVAFIGQKYGYRPFPPTINAREFETITTELESVEGATELLSTWFKKDINAWPTVYTLQPVSSVLPHFIDAESPALQKNAGIEWEKIYAQLQKFLRQGARYCLKRGIMSNIIVEKYFISVTEYEIQRGLLCSPEASADGLCFMREITNLEANIAQRRAHKYIDITTTTSISSSTSTSSSSSSSSPGVTSSSNTCIDIDVEAQKLLESLRKDKILKSMNHQNVVFFRMTWKDTENRSPSDDVEYLERFCNTFCTKMREQIDRSASRQRHTACSNSQVVEIHQHLAMCRKRARSFRGRDDLLERVRLRLQARASSLSLGNGRKRDNLVLVGGVEDQLGAYSSMQPIVLHGRPGSGRTSLIAKVAYSIKTWLPHCKPIIILRFLGASSRSCSIRLVLGTICWQLSSVLNVETSVVPDDYPGLVELFHGLLQLATVDRPLVFLLDALDQLSLDHRAHCLAWLPNKLPPNVFFIVSTLTDHPTFDVLSIVCSATAEGSTDRSWLVEVPALGRSLALSLVREWLKTAGRGLTSSQLTIVGDAFAACSLPLYITLVFDEVRRWSSYDPPERTTLEKTVEAAIARLLDRVERYHGRVFVSHALGYMTASKDGLSEVELDDLLSLDDVVLNDVFQHWLPPVRRIPPLLVPRLQDALSSYIVRREANGTVVLYWYNAEFLNVARRRYLFAESQRLCLHSVLGHYFMGTWGGGRRKPFKYSRKQLVYMSQKRNPRRRRLSEDETADRMVPRQPLHFGPDPRFPGRLNYNLRKLSELPHHLLQSGMISELKSQVLFNYDWLHAKLCATSLHDVLHDFDVVLKCGRLVSDVDRTQVALVASALRVGGSHVGKNPNSLAFELLGQLLVYYDRQPTSSTSSPTSSELPPVIEEVSSDDVSVSNSSALSPNVSVSRYSPDAGLSSSTLPIKPRVEEKSSNSACFESDEQLSEVRPVAKARHNRILRGTCVESGIRTLLQQCDTRAPVHSALLPILPCFDPPSAAALCVLEGHSGIISDIAFLPSLVTTGNRSQSAVSGGQVDELISIAADGTLALWDLAHGGERSRAINVTHLSPGRRARLFPISNNAITSFDANGSPTDGGHRSLAVVDADSPGSAASIIDLHTGQTVRSFGNRDPSVQSGVRLSGRLLCRQRSIYDVTSGIKVASLDRLAPGSGYLAVALQSTCDDGPSRRRRILLGGVGVSTRLFDIDLGSVLATLDSGETSSSAASSVALTRDGRLAFVGYAESCQLCVFSVDENETAVRMGSRLGSFDCRKVAAVHHTTVAGEGNKPSATHPVTEEISELTVNPADDIRVLINVSGRQLIVYDSSINVGIPVNVTSLRTLDGGRSLGGYSITKSTFSGDGRLVVAATDSAFHVWMSVDGRLLRTVQLHTQAGFPMVVTGRGSLRNLVATGSTLHTSIRVWNLDAMSQSSTQAKSKIEFGIDKELPVYDGPVDCMAVARTASLVFVRRQVSLSTHAGYKYAGWCGLDVWDISSARCHHVLPFDRYGHLLQIETTPEADRLALLFQAVDDARYVVLTDLQLEGANGITRDPIVADHSRCASFVVSPEWRWLATWCPERAEFKMWYIGSRSNGDDAPVSAVDEKNGVTFSEAACPPSFTFDSLFAVYVDRRDRTLVVYGLRQMAPRWRSQALTALDGRVVFRVRALPVRHHHVMVTCRWNSQSTSTGRTLEDDDDEDEDNVGTSRRHQTGISHFRTTSKITIWRLFDGDDGAINPIVELSGTVACRRGIVDVSKDGLVGVDGHLQVFDLKNGSVISRFRLPIVASSTKLKSPVLASLAEDECTSTSSSSGVSSEDDESTARSARELTRVQLTDDGKYVVWTERRVVCVGRVSDSTVVACSSVHERITGLSAGLDYGYTLLVGRQDGRVLTARLMVAEDGCQRFAAYRPSSFEDRVNFLLDVTMCSEETKASFDVRYHAPERTSFGVRPNQLPTAPLPIISDRVKSSLLRRADRPHTVLMTMTSPANHRSKPVSAEIGNGYQRHHIGREHRHRRKASGRVEKPTKDHVHLPRITGLWLKTTPVTVGRPMVEHLLAHTDHNGNEQHQSVAIDGGGTGMETLRRGQSPFKETGGVDKSVVIRRRLAHRRDRGELITREEHSDLFGSDGGDGGRGGHRMERGGRVLKLNVDIATRMRRPDVTNADGSSTGTASKTVTSSAATTHLATPVNLKCFTSPRISPIRLLRINDDGVGDSSTDQRRPATIIATAPRLNHRQKRQLCRGGVGGLVVPGAIQSSGRMMLKLCGFDITTTENRKLSSSDGMSGDDTTDFNFTF